MKTEGSSLWLLRKGAYTKNVVSFRFASNSNNNKKKKRPKRAELFYHFLFVFSGFACVSSAPGVVAVCRLLSRWRPRFVCCLTMFSVSFFPFLFLNWHGNLIYWTCPRQLRVYVNYTERRQGTFACSKQLSFAFSGRHNWRQSRCFIVFYSYLFKALQRGQSDKEKQLKCTLKRGILNGTATRRGSILTKFHS